MLVDSWLGTTQNLDLPYYVWTLWYVHSRNPTTDVVCEKCYTNWRLNKSTYSSWFVQLRNPSLLVINIKICGLSMDASDAAYCFWDGLCLYSSFWCLLAYMHYGFLYSMCVPFHHIPSRVLIIEAKLPTQAQFHHIRRLASRCVEINLIKFKGLFVISF